MKANISAKDPMAFDLWIQIHKGGQVSLVLSMKNLPNQFALTQIETNSFYCFAHNIVRMDLDS